MSDTEARNKDVSDGKAVESTKNATVAKVEQEGKEAESISLVLKSVLSAAGGKENAVKAVRDVVKGVLPDNIADTRERAAHWAGLLATGSLYMDACEGADISSATISGLKSGYPAFKSLVHVCQDVGLELLKASRVRAAHRRAVDGWDEPVFGKDGQVGTIKRYSDRLLEMLLRGDDPQRYNPQPTGSTSGGQGSSGPIAIQINIVQPHNADKTPTITIESQET